MPTRRGLYSILDTKADELTQPLIYMFSHEAAAIRWFSDICNLGKGIVAEHPQDHNLVRLGWVNHDETVADDYRRELENDFATILTGKEWSRRQHSDEEPNAPRLKL